MNQTDDRRIDRKRLLLLLLLALTVRVLAIANATVPSRDCIVFSRYALQFDDPVGTMLEPNRQLSGPIEVIRTNEHAPAYPVWVYAVSKVVRPIVGSTDARSMALSAMIATAITGVLFVVPAYFLLRSVFDRQIATAALVVFEVLPVLVEVTSDGISDGLFLLTVASALWFACRALESARRGALLYGIGAGVWVGIGSLTRPESAAIALAIGLTFAGAALCRWKARTAGSSAIFAGVGLVAGWLVTFGPYMYLIGGITNKPAGKFISGGDIDAVYFERTSRARQDVLFAAWWSPAENGGENRALWGANALKREYLKASYYVVPVFALIGLLAHLRRLGDARVVLLAMIALTHGAVLWVLAWRVGYVSERHTLIEVFVSCVFAALAFPVVGAAMVRWRKRGTPWSWGAIWVILIFLAAMPRNFQSMQYNRAGHKHAGNWLRIHGDPDVEVVDPFGWAEWYAGRTVTRWPDPLAENRFIDPKRTPAELYVIFEPNAKSPHSRLGKFEWAKRLHESAEKIYQYPVDAAPEKVKVAVYRWKK